MKLPDYSENLKDNYFKYSYEKIGEFMDKNKMQKVDLFGIDHNLQKIKQKIEEIYNEEIFYLSYWKDECVYHGWSWAKDDGTMENAAKITDGITDKFNEIYALILMGMGLEFKENENGKIDISEKSI